MKRIEFPDTGLRPSVDLLIGIVYLHLHSSCKEEGEGEGEPIVRQTLLELICVGYPESNIAHDVRTNFSKMTLFTINGSVSDVDEINSTMKKFWDIDSAGIFS